LSKSLSSALYVPPNFSLTTMAGVRVAVAGDAMVSESWLRSSRIYYLSADFHSADEARRSTSLLLESSEVIIPGHGLPFTSLRSLTCA